MNAPIEFLDSDTQDVSKTLLIAVAGTTGSGKTESALRIATGIAGDNFAVIDSENKRALNKKNRYRFRHFDMQPPYSPEHYREIIEAAVQKGFGAIVIDSFSAEWDDEGGLSDDAAEALERMSKGDAARAEKLTMLAWKNPKVRHRGLMRYFRKTDIPIIFCLRAEPKVKFMKDANGKQQIVDAGWLPITEKLFGYDMLIYALMMPENPGVPVHLKKLEPEFEPMFVAGKQVTEQSGKLLAQWAMGAAGKNSRREGPQGLVAQGEQYPGDTEGRNDGQKGGGTAVNPATPNPSLPTITPDEALALEARCTDNNISVAKLKDAANVARISMIAPADLPRAHEWVDKVLVARKAKEAP